MADLEKFFLKSKTIVGVLATFLVGVLPMVGITFGMEDGALITQLWDSVIQTATLGLAAYGRIKAQGSISATP